MKIVFMGTPDFALPTLKALAASHHSILAVVTQPDRPKGRGRRLTPPPVKLFAEAAGIDVLQPEKSRRPEFVETLKKLEPDLIVVVAFGQILSAEVLAIPRHFCMNLHGSILPRYRGAAPIQRAIINGETETGVTTMKMDVGLDTGDMLLIRKTSIEDNDDSQTLHDRLSEIGADLVIETIDKMEDGTLTATPQDDSLATHAPKLTKGEGKIQWNNEAVMLQNLVRGFWPSPGAYTFFKGRRIKLCQVETAPGDSADQLGVVAHVSDHGICVGTKKERLVITELQPEGKNKMPVKSFLAGNDIAVGDCLDSDSTPLKP